MFRPFALACVSSLALASCGGDPGVSMSPSLPPPGAPPQIFAGYSPDRDARMAEGWTRGFDMSGVSFNDTRTVTLITPRHVVMAKHYPRAAGSPIVFHDRGGNRIVRKIIGFMGAKGDVTVGLLDEPVPSNYTSYPLPDPSTDAARLVGRPVIITDQKRCLFVHLVDKVGGGNIAFKHDKEERYGWGKKLIVGDSGNPAFLISGKQLVLLETHSTGGPGAGPYYGDPQVQASIREAAAKLDPSHRIRTAKVF